MDSLFSHIEAFKILISQRGWYKPSGVLAPNASKDKKDFANDQLNKKKISKYLLAAGWTQHEDGRFSNSDALCDYVELTGNEVTTRLMQPTLMTNSRKDWKLVHYKIFTTIIGSLQPEMKAILKNKNRSSQLTLFKPNPLGYVDIEIPYKDFNLTTNRYDDLRRLLRSLAGTTVEFDTKDNWVISGLCKASIPKDKYKRSVKLTFDLEVAEALVSVHNGFTQFSKEIVHRLNSLYSIQFYLLCCSWKDKGGFRHTIEWLRHWLYLEDKYQSYKDFSAKVIKLAQKELREKADVWFEFTPVTKLGEKEPYMINFKVIHKSTPKELELINYNQRNTLAVWRDAFKFKDATIAELKELLTNSNSNAICTKTFELYGKIDDLKIKDPSSYAYTALLNEFEKLSL